MRRSHFTLSLIPLALSLGAQAPTRPVLVARLDSLARDFLVDAPAAGATVAVIKGSDTLLFSGFGEQDRERHLPADRATIYRIGSITKQFTSAAIMQHVQDGRLHLTDRLGTLLPEYPAWKDVTLRQLLNHTSGIHSYTASKSWAPHMADPLKPAEVMAYVASDTFDFAPGTAWRYNNSGYFLLGMILEKVEHKPYAQIVRDRFFAPLNMRSAAYCPNAPTDPHYAAGYDRQGASVAPTARLDLSSPYSAGALCMSVPDFLTWQTALTSGRVVSPATYTLMTTADTIASGLHTGYGFGLAPGMLGAHRLVQHGGDINGFSTQQLWFPDDSLRVVVFANTLGSAPDRLALNLVRATFGMPVVVAPKLPPIVPLAAADRAKYEGTYDLTRANGSVLPLHVWIEGDALVSQAEGPGQGKIPLRYLGNDVFGADFDPSVRLTFTIENGKAAKVRLLQGGGSIEGQRRP
jgi:D-alanyl-D-alanine carboxypeptidase